MGVFGSVQLVGQIQLLPGPLWVNPGPLSTVGDGVRRPVVLVGPWA